MMKLKSVLAGLVLALSWSGVALAQCGTVAPAQTVCGNSGVAQGLATWISIGSGGLVPVVGGTVLGNPTTGSAIPVATSAPVLGVPGTLTGQIGLAGVTSGTAILKAQAAAGSAISLLPTSSGTLVSTASAPLAINSATGLASITGLAGGVLAGSGPAFTITPVLGVPGASLGTLGFAGNTSGTVTVRAQAAAGTVTLTLPNTAGTFAVGATSPLALNPTTGALTLQGATGSIVIGSGGTGSSFSPNPVLGVAGTTVGSLGFQNATSGTETIQPATGALATGVATLPAGTYNLVGDTLTQTLTNKSLTFPTITSGMTYGGVSVGGTPTGTGNLVLSASPTFSGTVAGNNTHPLALLSIGTQDTVIGYWGSTSATATAVPNCLTGAINYSTSTHTWSCNTGVGTGNVVNSGTPLANQVAQWVSSTAIQGVNIASLLTAGTGITISGATNATVGLTSGATQQASPSNPTGTTSTGSAVMMGLGTNCTITPAWSSKIMIQINGVATNTASGGGFASNMRWGTGSAPSNGAASSGTIVGTTVLANTASANYNMPFSTSAIVTGLSAGTAYWFDMGLAAQSSGTASMVNVTCNAQEVQ